MLLLFLRINEEPSGHPVQAVLCRAGIAAVRRNGNKKPEASFEL